MLDEKDLQYLAEMEKRIDARMTEMADEARRGAVHDMQVIIENTIMPSFWQRASGHFWKPWRRRRGSRSWRTICSF